MGAVAAQLLSSVLAVVPVLALADLARTVLEPARGAAGADTHGSARMWWALAVAAAGSIGSSALAGVASSLTHLADGDHHLQVQRSSARHVSRLPLGWTTSRGRVARQLGYGVEPVRSWVRQG